MVLSQESHQGSLKPVLYYVYRPNTTVLAERCLFFEHRGNWREWAASCTEHLPTSHFCEGSANLQISLHISLHISVRRCSLLQLLWPWCRGAQLRELGWTGVPGARWSINVTHRCCWMFVRSLRGWQLDASCSDAEFVIVDMTTCSVFFFAWIRSFRWPPKKDCHLWFGLVWSLTSIVAARILSAIQHQLGSS